MNILFVTPWIPYPPIAGGKLQSFLRLKGLKKKGHGVFLISLAETGDYPFVAALNSIIDDLCCVYAKRDFAKVIDLFRKSLLYEIFTFDKSFGESIKRFSDEKKIDVAVFESLAVAQYRNRIPHIPSVLCEFNVEREMVEQLVASIRRFLPALLKRDPDRALRDIYLYLFGNLEEKLVARRESKALNEFDLCVTCSERDMEMLKDYCGKTRCVSIPWCVEKPSSSHVPLEKDVYDLVFVGSMDWEPNRDAAIWFAGEIFPLLQSRLRNIRLLIAGSHPTGELKGLDNGKDILVKGFVPDISKFLVSGDIFVAPLRFGGGVKVKVLEAMSHGLPVVATSKAAEGLDVRNEEHLFIADTPEDFAQSIIILLNSRDTRRSMGMKGREYTSKYHGIDETMSLFERCLSHVMESARRGIHVG